MISSWCDFLGKFRNVGISCLVRIFVAIYGPKVTPQLFYPENFKVLFNSHIYATWN